MGWRGGEVDGRWVLRRWAWAVILRPWAHQGGLVAPMGEVWGAWRISVDPGKLQGLIHE